MNIYHHSRILNISKTGLSFFDGHDQMILIDFEECRNNWVNYINSSEDSETIDLSPDQSVCIGRRDAFEKPIYIELFTNPRTRFIYPYKRNIFEWIRNTHGMKAYKYFRKTCIELEENGWTTFDLG